MDQSLNQVIVEAKRGDRDAFAKLVRHYQGPVFRHAYAVLGDRMEAEDASQEAFLKAYRSLARLDSEYAFSSWLTRIVSHVCSDRLQKRKTERALDDRLSAAIHNDSEMERRELRHTIEEAMSRLSPEHREAVALRDVQGYSYDEIADILQIPLGTVKSRINAARAQLRQELRNDA